MRKIDKKLKKKIQRSLFKIIIENYWIRNKLTRHMNQAGGIKPELQLRGENKVLTERIDFHLYQIPMTAN